MRRRRETSLLSSEQLFRTTYERAVIGIAHVSPEGRWLRFNQRLCDLLGYSREELAVRTFHDITHPDDREASDAYFQRLLAGELDAYELDKRYIRKDGVPVWVHVTVSLVRTPEGAPEYTISMVQDITERKRLEQEHAARAEAEAALARATASEAQVRGALSRLSTILETMADAVAVYDRCGRIVQSNRAYRELLATECIPGFDDVPLADRVPLLDLRDAATGEPIPFAQFPPIRALLGDVAAESSMDYRIRTIDGRELVVNSSAAPLRDGDGRVVGAVVVLRDITWRKRLERERDEALARAQASEAQATERAERLRTILETMTDGVFVYDWDGRVVQSNRAYRELIAADRLPGIETLPVAERIRLLKMRDIATGEPLPLDRVPGMRALRGEVVTERDPDCRIQTLDGRELEVSVCAAPLRDRDGRIVGAVSVVRDGTWRRRLEREREEALARATASEAQATERAERLNTILETMADGVVVYDQEGYVLQCNRAYRELAGADRLPGFEALPISDRIRLLDMRDAVTGEPLPLDRVPGMRALRGEVVTGAEGDHRIRALDGREVEMNLSAAPLRDRDGRVVGAVSVLRDLTERKRLEREREEALARATASEAQAAERAERLHTILETMADGVFVYDQEGRLIQSNRAYRGLLATDRVPGYEALPLAERIRLLDIRDIATGEPFPLEQVPGVRALRGEVVTGADADERIRALDGRELEVNLSAAPLHNGAGRVVGAVSVLRDLTERKRLEREREEAHAHELALRELNRRKDEFLGVVSHEIRTPLATLQGYFQLLARRLTAWRPEEGAADLARHVAQVQTALAYSETSVQRLTRLADDLADDARIRDGRLTLRRAPCDLGAIAEQAVEEQRALEPDRAIRLEPPAPPAPLELPAARPARVLVIADADRIAQVLTNYLTNALKYSKADRPVVVRLEVEGPANSEGEGGAGGEWARVSVRDEGPGLPPAVAARVWERFPPIEGPAVQIGSGVSLGLGLHISKAIIEAHGGQVGVESAVGCGSTFWFTLPLGYEASTQTINRVVREVNQGGL